MTNFTKKARLFALFPRCNALQACHRTEQQLRLFNSLFCTSSSSSSLLTQQQSLFKEEINILYDSKCSLCAHEMAFLAKQDKHGRLKFTDIEEENYDENSDINGRVSYEKGMKVMHAVKQNGEIIEGVEVIREIYKVVGLGWLFSWTRLPGIGAVVDQVYKYWAAYRTNLTRGVDVNELIAKRNETLIQKAKAVGEATCSSESTENGQSACEIKMGKSVGK